MFIQLHLVIFFVMQNVIKTISMYGSSTKIASKRDSTYSGQLERL